MEKKTSKSISKTKENSRSKSTQTDSLYSDLQDQLKEKDQRIHELEKELIKYKKSPKILEYSKNTPDSGLNTNKNSSHPQNYSYSGQFDLFPLNKTEKSEKKTIEINTKLPLDTANIEELDNLIEKSTLNMFSTKYLAKKQNSKPLPPMKSKSSVSRYSKLSLKSKSKLHKNVSIISELVFEDDQDKESWNYLVSKFREDPGLIGQALNFKVSEELKARNSVSIEPPNKKRLGSAYKHRKLSQEIYNEARPISANIRKLGRNYRPITGKYKDIDWSKSILDSHITQGSDLYYDSDFLSYNQIEDLILSKNCEDFDNIFLKATKTLERLKSELMVSKSYMIVPPKSPENFESLLKNCSQLFKARALVLKILKLIHMREDAMLKLMACEDSSVEKQYLNMQKLGQEICQIIIFLKHSKFPIGSFIYLGEDYASKIQKDNETLLNLFPNIKVAEIFEGFNL